MEHQDLSRMEISSSSSSSSSSGSRRRRKLGPMSRLFLLTAPYYVTGGCPPGVKTADGATCMDLTKGAKTSSSSLINENNNAPLTGSSARRILDSRTSTYSHLDDDDPNNRDLQLLDGANPVYQDTCTSDSFDRLDRALLCQDTFTISTLAYNPSGPRLLSTLTLVLRPSLLLERTTGNQPPMPQFLIQLPGFSLPASLKDYYDADGFVVPNRRALNAKGMNEPLANEDPAKAYNTEANPITNLGPNVKYGPVSFDFDTYTLFIFFGGDPSQNTAIRPDRNMNLEVCCFILPNELAENAPGFTIYAKDVRQYLTADGPENSWPIPNKKWVPDRESIPYPQVIKNVPPIFRVNFFTHLEVNFDPALSNTPGMITVKMRINAPLRNGARLVFHIPDMLRNPASVSWKKFLETQTTGMPGQSLVALQTQGTSAKGAVDSNGEPIIFDPDRFSGLIEFSTSGSYWTLFEFYAAYNSTEKTITFFLRQDQEMPADVSVAFKTAPDDFILPKMLRSNSPKLQVAAFSYDGVDSIIAETPVFQSDRIQEMRRFLTSQLSYGVPQTNAEGTKTSVHVTLAFQTNTPLWADSMVLMRLPGFSSEVTEVPLSGPYVSYFRNQKAIFDLAANVISVTVLRTLYSQAPNTISVTYQNLGFPPAMYENDVSILIWNVDWDGVQSEKMSVQLSPAINGGMKEFVRSEVKFSPNIPDIIANVTFTILPSINFFQGDEVLLYLYGFRCSSSEIMLSGNDAHRFTAFGKVGRADWTQATWTLTLRVAPGRILSRVATTVFTIAENVGFRLPDKLSKNDGILNIEGRGAYIAREGFKLTPRLGPPKYITDSRMEFQPETPNAALADSIARILFSFKANSDIRPNSTVVITMGGLTRLDPSPVVILSGKNAPMFTYNGQLSAGRWDPVLGELHTTIIPNLEPIPAGVSTEFFLETDQKFQLPNAMYQNDPSLRIRVPEAGIPEQIFNFTSRVNEVAKSFTTSELGYGDNPNSVAHPYEPSALRISFKTNVDLPSGTTIRLTLKDFQCGVLKPQLFKLDPNSGAADEEKFLRESVAGIFRYYGTWNQETFSLDLTLREGKTVEKDIEVKLRIASADVIGVSVITFRLPGELKENDERLTIETISKQIILPQPIKKSTRVVDRSFEISTFTYEPRTARSTFMMGMTFKPTVDIDPNQPIILTLYGFTNALVTQEISPIHLTGRDANRIEASKASWNRVTQKLEIKIATGDKLLSGQTLSLSIQESQGFQLPNNLNQNDPDLKVKSGGGGVDSNIKEAVVKSSPMVGDGPDQDQKFCMYQYESGTRTLEPRMSQCNSVCDGIANPLIIDPCDGSELERCGCISEFAPDGSPLPLTIRGFQLVDSDRVGFVPVEFACPDLPQNFVDFIKGQTFGSTSRATSTTNAAASASTDSSATTTRRRLVQSAQREAERRAEETFEFPLDDPTDRGRETVREMEMLREHLKSKIDKDDHDDTDLEQYEAVTTWFRREMEKHLRTKRGLRDHVVEKQRDRAFDQRTDFARYKRAELLAKLHRRRRKIAQEENNRLEEEDIERWTLPGRRVREEKELEIIREKDSIYLVDNLHSQKLDSVRWSDVVPQLVKDKQKNPARDAFIRKSEDLLNDMHERDLQMLQQYIGKIFEELTFHIRASTWTKPDSDVMRNAKSAMYTYDGQGFGEDFGIEPDYDLDYDDLSEEKDDPYYIQAPTELTNNVRPKNAPAKEKTMSTKSTIARRASSAAAGATTAAENAKTNSRRASSDTVSFETGITPTEIPSAKKKVPVKENEQRRTQPPSVDMDEDDKDLDYDISTAYPRRLQAATTTTTTTLGSAEIYKSFLAYDPFSRIHYFRNYTSRELSVSADELKFYNVSALETGFFRICFQHFSQIFDIGMIIVRPKCPPTKVAVDGTICVTNCPVRTIPVAGKCRDIDTVLYSDPTPYLKATQSKLLQFPSKFVPPFIVPGTIDTTMAENVATSIAESLIRNSLDSNSAGSSSSSSSSSSSDSSSGSSSSSGSGSSSSSGSGSSSSGSTDGTGGAQGVQAVDPNLRVDLIGHRQNPFMLSNGTTYTATTTKGGTEDVYSTTIMVPIKMSSAEAVQNKIWERGDDHPERLYYEYRFRYELAILLGVISENFKIASITESRIGGGDNAITDGVIVNTVFTNTGSVSESRSPMELLHMLRALQADMSSALHSNEFFKYIFRDYQLNAILVSRCPDADFRAICPYMESIMPTNTSYIVYIASVQGIALMLALFFLGAWRCDHDAAETKSDKQFFQKAGKGEPQYLDPGLQQEYAKSWLEGRYMGDEL